MVKTFTAEEASRALILVKAITEDLKREMDILVDQQSRGLFPTEPEVKLHVDRLKHHFEELKQLGCVAREPQLGLIDFPSFHQGEPVFLCWHLGEEEVDYWHSIHEDHTQRQVLTDSTLVA